jgi:hypothetical protein
VYGEPFTTYTFGRQSDTLCNWKDFPDWREKKAHNHYMLAVPNTTNETHWFHTIILPGDDYEEHLYTGRHIRRKQQDMYVSLYNFFSISAKVQIELNDQHKEIELSGQSEKRIHFTIESPKESNTIRIRSENSKIGIIQYEFSVMDQQLSYQEEFSKYKFSQPNIISPRYRKNVSEASIQYYIEQFAHFAYRSGELMAIDLLDTISTFNNLLIQRRRSIKDLDLKQIEYPSLDSGDYLVIYHETFEALVPALVSVLEQVSPGDSIKAIDVQKIYNKYSKSSISSQAIKQYISQLGVKKVLLIGDARPIPGLEGNLVPTFYQKDLLSGVRYATDFPYSYTSNPTNPMVQVSRIPAKSANELFIYLDKVRKFLNQDQRNSTTLIFDDVSLFSPTEVADTNLIHYEISKSELITETLFKHRSILEINKVEPYLIYYTGHGSLIGWSRRSKIGSRDFSLLEKDKYFILIDLSCSTGAFSSNNLDCFSEKLLFMPEKGPVTILSATTNTRISAYKSIWRYFQDRAASDAGISDLSNNMKKQLFKTGKMNLMEIHAFNVLGIPDLRLALEIDE